VTGKDRRQELLDQAIDYVAATGLGDTTLRSLAAALGTSHRMLIHYFGSKEGLWVAIVRAVEERQRRVLADKFPEPGRPLEDEMRAWWQHISDPALWPNERLFFELYGQALQGRPHTAELLDGIVESWVGPAAELAIARGTPPPLARAHARLGIAVVRGLLLDLLATGERREVDAAMDAFIELSSQWPQRSGAEPSDQRGHTI
jgi:AcrR family transcriptional regulator